AMQLIRKHLDRTATILSAHRQLAMNVSLRAHLDLFLTLARRANVSPERAYGPVLAWKGSVLARQLRPGGGAAAAPLRERQEAARDYAYAITVGDRQRAERALARLEELDGQLAQVSPPDRERREDAQLTPRGLARCLPEGVVLID